MDKFVVENPAMKGYWLVRKDLRTAHALWAASKQERAVYAHKRSAEKVAAKYSGQVKTTQVVDLKNITMEDFLSQGRKTGNITYMLRTCNHDMTAWRKFKWPKSGPVECPDWVDNNYCGHGLHGLLLGKGSISYLGNGNRQYMICAVWSTDVKDIGDKIKVPRAWVCFVSKNPHEAVAFMATKAEVTNSHFMSNVVTTIPAKKKLQTGRHSNLVVASKGANAKITMDNNSNVITNTAGTLNGETFINAIINGSSSVDCGYGSNIISSDVDRETFTKVIKSYSKSNIISENGKRVDAGRISHVINTYSNAIINVGYSSTVISSNGGTLIGDTGCTLVGNYNTVFKGNWSTVFVANLPDGKVITARVGDQDDDLKSDQFYIIDTITGKFVCKPSRPRKKKSVKKPLSKKKK